MKYFLVNMTFFKVVDKEFATREEAMKYKKEWRHVASIRDAKVVYGTADAYGAVTVTS